MISFIKNIKLQTNLHSYYDIIISGRNKIHTCANRATKKDDKVNQKDWSANITDITKMVGEKIEIIKKQIVKNKDQLNKLNDTIENLEKHFKK